MRTAFKNKLPDIAGPLLRWYEVSARELPWRLSSPDPYRTLVSEIMLQQTRVETVKPYYERFIAALPDLQSLAAAEEEQLLKLWEGLGYYSRVRNLQKAARAIVTDFDGKIPAQPDRLRKLPGIGEYTAGAIASIAFGLPEPAVDGNVLRVCSRLGNSRDNIGDPGCRETVRRELRAIYPPNRCSEFTQALMDLGALVCLPGTPRCGDCPLNELCGAYHAGTAQELPVKKTKAARRIESKTVFLLHSSGGRIALRKRPDKGILAGLWEYPSVSGQLTRAETVEWLTGQDLNFDHLKKGRSRKHVFTHVEWHMTVWKAECSQEHPAFAWVTKQELETVFALPSAFKGFC